MPGCNCIANRQLAAYQFLCNTIADFDLLDLTDISLQTVSKQLIEVIDAFKRGWLFFDDATIKTFDVRISMPWKNGEFASAIAREDAQVLYDEMCHRLNGEVLVMARSFIKKQYPHLFS
ncbi:MAG: hypothetical protein Greene041614_477 [Parcubacteria group bacterium Greene0416_14]|nr:MAG: hypothetical protein Greene041614_477 [Parcubacteria group bacterium Greene0416_14]